MRIKRGKMTKYGQARPYLSKRGKFGQARQEVYKELEMIMLLAILDDVMTNLSDIVHNQLCYCFENVLEEPFVRARFVYNNIRKRLHSMPAVNV
jgi:hypothetical protein